MMKVTALKGTQRIGINVRMPVEHGVTVQVKFCSFCLCTGHSDDECPIRQCYHCGRFGHVERDCPAAQTCTPARSVSGYQRYTDQEVFRNFRRKGSISGCGAPRSPVLRRGPWKRACGVVPDPEGYNNSKREYFGDGLFSVQKVQEKKRDADAETDEISRRAYDMLLQLSGVWSPVEGVKKVRSGVPSRDFEDGFRSVVLERGTTTHVRL